MIILMGVAGAGKSLQGRLLADELGYSWVSTGEILRVIITGKRRQEMLRGKLLSDDEVIKVIDKVSELLDPEQEVVLDGFPRTIVQADWLLDQVSKGKFVMTAVINLKATKKTVHDRLLNRGRLDDNEEVITQRFEEYERETLPILKHFKDVGIIVYDINTERSPEQIHSEIVKIIKANL